MNSTNYTKGGRLGCEKKWLYPGPYPGPREKMEYVLGWVTTSLSRVDDLVFVPREFLVQMGCEAREEFLASIVSVDVSTESICGYKVYHGTMRVRLVAKVTRCFQVIGRNVSLSIRAEFVVTCTARTTTGRNARYGDKISVTRTRAQWSLSVQRRAVHAPRFAPTRYPVASSGPRTASVHRIRT